MQMYLERNVPSSRYPEIGIEAVLAPVESEDTVAVQSSPEVCLGVADASHRGLLLPV